MMFLRSISNPAIRLVAILAFAFTHTICAQSTTTAAEQHLKNAAPIRVIVRDPNGRAVIGLNANDFFVTIGGRPVPVLAAEPFSSTAQRIAGSDAAGQTDILLLFPPMTPTEERHRLRDVLKYFKATAAEHWEIAILDPHGKLWPYSENASDLHRSIRSILRESNSKFDIPTWEEAAHQAMMTLGKHAGRRVAVLNIDAHFFETRTGKAYPPLFIDRPHSIATDALESTIELYQLNDLIDMPATIFTTVQDYSKGQVFVDGRTIDITSAGTIPVTGTGEQESYSVKVLLDAIHGNSAASYDVLLPQQISCPIASCTISIQVYQQKARVYYYHPANGAPSRPMDAKPPRLLTRPMPSGERS